MKKILILSLSFAVLSLSLCGMNYNYRLPERSPEQSFFRALETEDLALVEQQITDGVNWLAQDGRGNGIFSYAISHCPTILPFLIRKACQGDEQGDEAIMAGQLLDFIALIAPNNNEAKIKKAILILNQMAAKEPFDSLVLSTMPPTRQ